MSDGQFLISTLEIGAIGGCLGEEGQMAMDEMKRGRLVMKWSLTILENNDKEDLDLRNSSEMESTLLRKLLGLGKGKEG